jgi:hypothetical protein
MLKAMGLRNWWSKVVGPPRIAGGHGDDPGEVAAALQEDYGAPHPPESQIKKDELAEDLAAAPVAETPFATAGESRAAEIEIAQDPELLPEDDDEVPLEPET